MKELIINIEIDENANIKADTKGFTGPVCITELKEVLDGVDDNADYKKKPEFYQKNNVRSLVKNNI